MGGQAPGVAQKPAPDSGLQKEQATVKQQVVKREQQQPAKSPEQRIEKLEKKVELLTDAVKDVMEKGNPKQAYEQLAAEERWQRTYTGIFGILTAAAVTMVVVSAALIGGPIIALPTMCTLAFGSNTYNGYKKIGECSQRKEQALELHKSLTATLGKIEKLDGQA